MEGIGRPEAIVLPDTSLIPPRNRISPAPNQFTHVMTRRQPFYFLQGPADAPANGELSAGAQVVLMVHDGGPWCWVADASGLYVVTAFEGLTRL